MSRILIAGSPRSGKSTLSERIGQGPVHHTDDLIYMGWSEASLEASTWFNEPGPWVIEGVAVPRALRKWLEANPEGKPCDVVIWLEIPFVELTSGQNTMARGCSTVWNQVVGELVRRGVEIRYGMQ